MQDMTFFDLWCQEYNNYLMIRLKKQSYRKINSNFQLHILPFFKDYKLKDINSKVYLEWMNKIKEKGFKNSYNANLHTTMVGILNYAVKFDYIDTNVASKIGGFSKKKNEVKNIDFWTLEEYRQFISVVDDDLYKLLFNTLFFTGLRVGECLALTWNDFKYNYLDINKTISKEKNKNNNYIINSPKTPTSIRKIRIDDELIELFSKLYESQKQLSNFNNSWFIFGGIKPITHTTLTRRKDKYCEIAKVKKIRLHDFRHSHATLLVSKSVPITVISQRLGHSDTNMTLNTYSHLVLTDIDKAVDMINTIKLTNC